MFENEIWQVRPQTATRIRRDEDVSVIGILIEAVDEQGDRTEIVSAFGMGCEARDMAIASLFAASKDLYNAAAVILPMLEGMNPEQFTPEQEQAIAVMARAMDRASNGCASDMEPDGDSIGQEIGR